MNLLEYKECTVISWDSARNVYGVKLKAGKNGRLSVKQLALCESKEDFSRALADVYNKIKPVEDELVILSGSLPGCACVELQTPKLSESDLAPAITYELTRLLPFSLDEIVTGFRALPFHEGQNVNRVRVRIQAILKKEWETLLSDINNAGVKMDAMIHPLMAVDPILSNVRSVFLKQIDHEFSFSFSSSELIRKVERVGEPEKEDEYWRNTRTALMELVEPEGELDKVYNPDDYIPALLVGAYVLSHEFEKDKPFLFPIPREMFPERFRGLRTLFIILSIFGIMLLLGMGARNFWENRQRLLAIKNEIKSVDRKITEIKDDRKSNLKFDEFISKFEELEPDMGNHEVIYCLQKLHELIPESMWATSLSFRRNEVEANIIAKSDSSEDLGDFSNSLIFSKPEINKRTNPDGTVNLHLKLQHLIPLERQKPKEPKESK